MNAAVNQMKLLEALQSALREVPAFASVRVRRDIEIAGRRLDAVLVLHFRGLKAQRWVVELRSLPVEPYAAGFEALGLPEAVRLLAADYAAVVAPFVSPRSAEILRRAGVGYCDLSGNCYLAHGPLLIERTGFPNAFARKASQGSLFTPGSERVVRVVLDPAYVGRPWRVRDLADAAWPGVSLGQAHKVAKRLEKEAYLRRRDDGYVVQEPDKLLGAWVTGYRAGRNHERRYYSPLSLDELRRRFGAVANWDAENEVGGVLASFTAAEFLAPAVRQHRFFAYWIGNRGPLVEQLELKAVASGENVVLYEPYDHGVFYPAPQVPEPVTCPVQTYLDLRAAPGRGEEAAQAVFDRWLKEAYAR